MKVSNLAIFALALIASLKIFEADAKHCKYPKGHTMVKYKTPSKICKQRGTLRHLWGKAKDLIVKTHNELRQKVAAGLETNGNQPAASNMRKVVWNNEIAMIAQKWANQCKFGHDQSRNKCDGKYVGQNVYWSSVMMKTQKEQLKGVVDAIKSWYSEVKKPFTTSIDPFKWNSACGHYTQVVWAETSEVGCGFSSNKAGTNIVCNYAVGGNMIGGTMYKKGPGCSACPRGTSCDSTY